MRSLDSFKKSEGFVLDIIVIIVVVLFCLVITIFLAAWHKDTHHNLVHPEFKLGDTCDDCQSNSNQVDDIEGKFCSADVVLIARVGPIARNLSSTLRLHGIKIRQVLKKNKQIFKKIPAKSLKSFIFNTTAACNYWFDDELEYLLSGKVILPPKVSHATFVVSPCDLAFQWTGLSLERRFLFREILDDDICKTK